MRVLVTWASKYGGTAGIGEAIADELRDRGLQAIALPVEEVHLWENFDAAVVGSGVYIGQWLKPAREFVRRHRRELAEIPTWLFSSGPIGEPLRPAAEAVDVVAATEAIGPRDHRLFAGRIVRRELGFADRALVRALRVPDGDWRDWDAVRAWAGEIADALKDPSRAPAPKEYQPWAVGGRW